MTRDNLQLLALEVLSMLMIRAMLQISVQLRSKRMHQFFPNFHIDIDAVSFPVIDVRTKVQSFQADHKYGNSRPAFTDSSERGPNLKCYNCSPARFCPRFYEALRRQLYCNLSDHKGCFSHSTLLFF
jgi:hypothetical protein